MIADLSAAIRAESFARLIACDLYPGEIVRTRLYLGLLG